MGACQSSRNAACLADEVLELVTANTPAYLFQDGKWVPGKVIERLEGSSVTCNFNEVGDKTLNAANASIVIIEIWRNKDPATWGVPVVEYWWKTHNRANETIQKYSHLVQQEEISGAALMESSFNRETLQSFGVSFGTAIAIIKGRDALRDLASSAGSANMLPSVTQESLSPLPNVSSANPLGLHNEASYVIPTKEEKAVKPRLPVLQPDVTEPNNNGDDSDSSSDGGEFNFSVNNSQPVVNDANATYASFGAAQISLNNISANSPSSDNAMGTYMNFAETSRIPQSKEKGAANNDEEEDSSSSDGGMNGFSFGASGPAPPTAATTNANAMGDTESFYHNFGAAHEKPSTKPQLNPDGVSTHINEANLEKSSTLRSNNSNNADSSLGGLMPAHPMLTTDVSAMAPDSRSDLSAPHPSAIGAKYYANQEVEVLSATSEAWVLARVHDIKEGVVTVKYMDRQKELREDSTKIRLPKQAVKINGIEYIKNDFENLAFRLKAALEENDMIKESKRIVFKSYHNVFSGADVVEVLSGLEAIDKREEAEVLAVELQREKVFYAIPKRNKDFANSKKSFYKFDDEDKDSYFAIMMNKRKYHKPLRAGWTRGGVKIECCIQNSQHEMQWVSAKIERYDPDRDVIHIKTNYPDRPWYDRYTDQLRPLSIPSRDQWADGQKLKIFSKSQSSWQDGKIIQTYKSYVRVAYGNQSKWMERESIKLRTAQRES